MRLTQEELLIAAEAAETWEGDGRYYARPKPGCSLSRFDTTAAGAIKAVEEGRAYG